MGLGDLVKVGLGCYDDVYVNLNPNGAMKEDPECILVGKYKQGEGLFGKRWVWVHIRNEELIGFHFVSTGIFDHYCSHYCGPFSAKSHEDAYKFFARQGVTQEQYEQLLRAPVEMHLQRRGLEHLTEQ